MLVRIATGLIAVLTAISAAPALALDCPAAEGRDSVAIAGELHAGEAFERDFGAGWRFVLEPVPEGWFMSVRNAGGDDLSWATPPLHGPNSREIHGWHFRNAANSGPNTGDVNAPQQLRLITFFPDTGELAGVASDERPAAEPAGRGAIEIVDMGLADLDPGQQARMVYLKFEGCLNWPAMDVAVPSASVSPELIEQMGACGLEWPLRVSGHLEPPGLSADFDGDGALDIAAAVINEDTGGFGLAVCRAGTWLDLIGAGHDIVGLPAGYLDGIDTWLAYPMSEIGSGTIAALSLVGDSLFVGEGGRYRFLLYWRGDGFVASDQGN